VTKVVHEVHQIDFEIVSIFNDDLIVSLVYNPVSSIYTVEHSWMDFLCDSCHDLSIVKEVVDIFIDVWLLENTHCYV